LIPRTPADVGKFHITRSANGGNDLDFWDSTDVRWMAAFGVISTDRRNTF
jgi:hypothetical protein